MSNYDVYIHTPAGLQKVIIKADNVATDAGCFYFYQGKTLQAIFNKDSVNHIKLSDNQPDVPETSNTSP